MTDHSHRPRPHAARDDTTEVAALVRLVIGRHGFHRVHASCAIATLLGGLAAVWVPLLIGTGGAPSTPRAIVGVLLATWLVGVTLNSLVVWVLVRIQPSPTIPADFTATGPDAASAGAVVGSARLLRLVALPGAVAGAALRHRLRRARVSRHPAVTRGAPVDPTRDAPGPSAARQRAKSSHSGPQVSRPARKLANRCATVGRALSGRHHPHRERGFG